MHKGSVRSQRFVLLALILTLALIFTACNGNNAEVEVEEPVVGAEEGALETETDLEAETEVETEAETDVEAEAEQEAEEVETEVETQVITDTEVLTQTEVITQADVAEVITETTVITDVQVEEDTVVETEVMTETADLGTETSPVQVQREGEETDAGFVIVVLTDAEGNAFLADAAEERPIFVYTGTEEGMIEDENIEPVGVDENIAISEDLDQGMFGVIDQDGFQQLAINDRPAYRYVGDEAEMQTLTQELELAPVTSEGEAAEFSQ